jgi:SAM-dependent methyltransferase
MAHPGDATRATRALDGSAGDADYGAIGASYSEYRQPDPRIIARIERALGSARSVLNVGAGTGSYEPSDRDVTAVEPSASMRAQRSPHASVAIDAVAEALPFADRAFDASLATFTVHQWTDLERGLREMRRVTRGPVIVLTCDPQLVQRFWLNEFAPEVLATEAKRYPGIDRIRSVLGGTTQALSVPIPLDCRDGFNEAYYGRPERLLDVRARLACSAWSFVDEATRQRYVENLRQALSDGSWDQRHGHLRTQPELDGSLRLIVAH